MDINAELEQDWPSLSSTQYRIISPHTPSYNCLAWAAQENDRPHGYAHRLHLYA